MTNSAFVGLIQNAALLLAVAFVYDVSTSRFRLGPRPLVQVLIGLLLGVFGCILILSPWTLVPGIVFDTRSVLLSISGLFFGLIPTLVAMAMTAALRLSLGGAAAWTGVMVILATGTMGIIWRHYRRQTLAKLSWSELYLFGFLTHLVMLALMCTLPWATARQVLAQITLPVLLIYPLATTLLGLLVANRLRREDDAATLLASEERMRLFFERQIAGMALTSPQKGWIKVNDELCRMLGYSRQELTGLTWAQLTHPDDLQADLDRFEQLLAGAIDEYSLEKRFIRKDGTIVWTELSVGCVRRADGTVDYILALLLDITERKKVEKSLRTNEERLRLALVAANQGLYDLNVQTGEAQVSPEYATMLGYDPAEFRETNAKWVERLHPDDRAAVAATYQDYIAGKLPEYRVEFRQRTKPGDWKWILSLGKVVEYDADGHPLRMLGTHTDITDRKQAEEALKGSEHRYRQLFTANPLPMWVYDLETLRFLAVNDAALQHYGYSHDEFLAMTIKDIRPAEDIPRLMNNVAQVQAGLDQAGNWRHLKKDGTVIEVEITSHTLEFSGRSAEMVLALDVTERHRAEHALIESEERYRTLVNNLPGVAYRCLNDEHWTMIFFSEGVKLMTGYPREDFIRNAVRSYASIIHPDDRVPVDRSVQAGVNARRPYEMEYRLIRHDKSIIWVYEKGQGVFDPTGKLLWLDGVIIDITAQRQAQEEKDRLQAQLLQAQKMESVGRLAGGVAHDFNNMLQTILGYCDLALCELQQADPLHENLLEIQKAAERSANLTRQLLAFARKQAVSPKVLDLNDTVAGMLKMLQRLIGEDIDLAWLPGHELWNIKIDPSQVDQLLANLMVNARDAIAGTGKVSIETENVTLDEAYSAIHPGTVPGDYVLLAVSDNGCGMDKDTMDHLFEPFFTTKKQGQGTGLGLATVYGVVTQNSGYINVYSEPGQGTTVRIYLPRFAAEGVAESETSRRQRPAGGTETILLVEDEEALLTLGRSILTRLGYTVLTAQTPAEALRIGREHAGEIELLIVDVIMPEMNGRDLATALIAIRPEAQCLYMSGYTADIIARHGVLGHDVHFIQKPFSVDELARKIREILKNA